MRKLSPAKMRDEDQDDGEIDLPLPPRDLSKSPENNIKDDQIVKHLSEHLIQ